MRLKTLCRPSYCLLALVLAALQAAAAHPRSSEGPRDGANGSPQVQSAACEHDPAATTRRLSSTLPGLVCLLQGLASHIPVAQSRQADSTDSADGLQPLQDVATSALQGSFSARRLTSNADTAAADAAHTNSDVTAGDQGGDETHPRRRNAKPTDDDFVVAMPAVLSRFKMALATRVWRQTLRTAIVVEDGSALDALQAEGVRECSAQLQGTPPTLPFAHTYAVVRGRGAEKGRGARVCVCVRSAAVRDVHGMARRACADHRQNHQGRTRGYVWIVQPHTHTTP